MVQQVVILAGGLGTRLGKLTENTPKPMLLVGGYPFIDYLIWKLKSHGIRNIILSTGYRSDKVTKYFNNNHINGLNVTCLKEPKPIGTGGALKFASSQLDSEFLVINGDTLFDIDYVDLYRLLHATNGVIVAMAIRQVSDASRYGQVITDGVKVKGFGEKAENQFEGNINGGVYMMKNKVLDMISEGESSLEHDLFPRLASEGLLVANQCDGYFIDVGIPNDFKRAQIELPLWKENRLSSL